MAPQIKAACAKITRAHNNDPVLNVLDKFYLRNNLNFLGRLK